VRAYDLAQAAAYAFCDIQGDGGHPGEIAHVVHIISSRQKAEAIQKIAAAASPAA
jgi:hypothetical protein